MKIRFPFYTLPRAWRAAAHVAEILGCLFLHLGLVALAGCATATQAPVKTTSSLVGGPGGAGMTTANARPQPSVIYVSDFYLDPDSIHPASRLTRKDGLVGSRLDRVRGTAGELRGEDPASRARKLIQVLSETIVQELNQAGQRAEYAPNRAGLRKEFHPTDAALPEAGWLVGGWFVNVQENNPAAEATVGFGRGTGEVEIAVVVYDLAQDARNPFLYIGTETGQRTKPGALVTMNPYAMGAKFHLARGATEKDVKKQAKAIARNLTQFINQGPAGR